MMEAELAKLIDYCASNGASDYDVARVVAAHDALKDKHRYTDLGWEYFDNETQNWKLDARGGIIGLNVTCLVSTACNERALFWQNRIISQESIDPYFDELRVMSLIELALKFKDKKFLRAVVNECKAFFE